jgi:hypothetical protein
MTKYFISTILISAFLFSLPNEVKASGNKVSTAAVIGHTDNNTGTVPAAELPQHSNLPENATRNEHGKTSNHPPALDETPHIHHYHKHRVRKLKKHHSKCWFIAQGIVIICNLVLLYMAYLHLVH